MSDQYRGKRGFDLAVLAIVGPPAAVIGAVCAVAVKVDSSGPVFFRQERIGYQGRPYHVLKFRTMVDNPRGNSLFPDASAITRVGKVLRRLSLDELPQLINVLLGEMSIVGPRPTLRYQVEQYDDFQRRRLEVKPGLTGLAQVNGRNSLTWEERIRWDVNYVETASPWLDLQLLAQTLKVVLLGEGVHGHPTHDAIANPDGLVAGAT